VTTDAEKVKEEKQGRWYILHTYSGQEERVKRNLEVRIQSLDMEGKIFRVVVPTEDEMVIRDGKRQHEKSKMFPGYILIRMLLDDESWYVVRNTPGVTGFVGSGTRPTPLAQSELERILRQMRAEEPRVKVGFQPGQSVRVVDGLFVDFVGQVDDINLEKGKVRVMVSFFGRETPVELDLLQVERL